MEKTLKSSQEIFENYRQIIRWTLTNAVYQLRHWKLKNDERGKFLELADILARCVEEITGEPVPTSAYVVPGRYRARLTRESWERMIERNDWHLLPPTNTEGYSNAEINDWISVLEAHGYDCVKDESQFVENYEPKIWDDIKY